MMNTQDENIDREMSKLLYNIRITPMSMIELMGMALLELERELSE